MSPWRLVRCPGTVRFSRIDKEPTTQARIYAVFGSDMTGGTVWISQSLAELVRHMRSVEIFVHVSSFYRIVRGEAKRNVHKGWSVRHCRDAQELNETLNTALPRILAAVVRDADRYVMECADATIDEIN